MSESNSSSDDSDEWAKLDDLDVDEREEVWKDRGGNTIQPDEDIEYELASNACYDLVKYIRSNTIKNEQQFILTTLGYMTGFFEEPDHFVSGVIIGTSSSGKTHLQKKLEDLFQYDVLYQATTGSDKAFIYDGDWDKCYVASLDELQKPSQEVIEFFKGVHGGDEEHIHKTTMGSTQEGFETETTVRKSKPYWFLYAQYDPDFEMWNRLLKVPVHESESKNIAVGAMAWDHHHISVEGEDVEYGYEFSKGSTQLKTHIAWIRDQIESGELPGYVHIPAGDQYDWNGWDIVKPIFNHSRSESNRIYEMVANLVRASALFNYHNRDVEEIYHPEYGTREAIIAEPQDVANVLACRETLVSTTHSLDDKRWAICNAIDEKGGDLKEVEGIGPITEYLKTSDATVPPESELENLIEDLADNYLIEVHPNAGDKGRDLYEFLGFDELGFARVPENRELFEDTFDPISGRNFIEVHNDLRDELESRGDDVMSDATTSSSTSTSSSQKGSLASFGSGQSVDLEPHEETVRDMMKDALDGERVRDLTSVPIEGLLGITDHESPEQDVETTGTILDPDHPVWKQPGKDDSWVTSVKDAKRECRRAVKKLVSEKIVRYETVHERNEEGKPIDATVAVVGEGAT